MARRRLKIFVGSSREQLRFARTVASWIESLESRAEVLVWDKPGLFRPGLDVWSQLVGVAESVDAGVFIFAPDDRTWFRGRDVNRPRDNAILELGLFAGRLGPPRAVFVSVGNTQVPSDLLGIVNIRYDNRAPNRAAVEVNAWVESLHGAPPQLRLRDADAAVASLRAQLARTPRQPNPVVAGLVKAVSDLLFHQSLYPEYLRRETTLTIKPNGDGHCLVRERVRQDDRPINVSTFVLKGDYPLSASHALAIQVRSLNRRHSVSFHTAVESATERRVVLVFDPAVARGKSIAYEVSWVWPGMWSRLLARKPDNWGSANRSRASLLDATIDVLVSRRLGEMSVENRGDGGQSVESIPAPRGYAGVRWRGRRVGPGKHVDLWVIPK